MTHRLATHASTANELDVYSRHCPAMSTPQVTHTKSITIDARRFPVPIWTAHVTADINGVIRACEGTPVEREDGTWNYLTNRVQYLGSTCVKTPRKFPVPRP